MIVKIKREELSRRLVKKRSRHYSSLRGAITNAASTRTSNTPPKMESGILKAASECKTAVVGRPPRYAIKKIPKKTAPTLCMANKNLFTCLLLNLNPSGSCFFLNNIGARVYLKQSFQKELHRFFPTSIIYLQN